MLFSPQNESQDQKIENLLAKGEFMTALSVAKYQMDRKNPYSHFYESRVLVAMRSSPTSIAEAARRAMELDESDLFLYSYYLTCKMAVSQWAPEVVKAFEDLIARPDAPEVAFVSLADLYRRNTETLARVVNVLDIGLALPSLASQRERMAICKAAFIYLNRLPGWADEVAQMLELVLKRPVASMYDIGPDVVQLLRNVVNLISWVEDFYDELEADLRSGPFVWVENDEEEAACLASQPEDQEAEPWLAALRAMGTPLRCDENGDMALEVGA